VYYWPLLGRGAPIFRLLEYKGVDYEWISDKAKMAEICSAFGADKYDTFAPPVVVDGDYVINQSTAATYYLGKKLGMEPAGFDSAKAFQHLATVVDIFEGGLAGSNGNGPTLKKFLEGGRWASLMANLERGIQGPFYFGAEPSCVDFFLFAHLDNAIATVFAPVKAKYGVDAMAPYAKCLAIHAALSSTDAYKASKFTHSPPIKDEILNSYNEETVV